MDTGEENDKEVGGGLQSQLSEVVSHTSASAFMAAGPDAFHRFVASKFSLAAGQSLPRLEIRVRDLSLSVETPVVHDNTVGAASSELPTLSKVLHRAVVKSLGACVPSFLKKQAGLDNHPTRRYILRNFSGVFKPGSMTLVLVNQGRGSRRCCDCLAAGSLWRATLSPLKVTSRTTMSLVNLWLAVYRSLQPTSLSRTCTCQLSRFERRTSLHTRAALRTSANMSKNFSVTRHSRETTRRRRLLHARCCVTCLK
ncbi:hypothetical protein PF003_g8176 [Phytophthora fragariae]|nr:hypothetical protein PF003_g8176 [Phytophthora fragariae]